MYKVGDIVLVRDDLIPEQSYGGVGFVQGMTHCRGNLVTIRKVLKRDVWSKQNLYFIEEDSRWLWSAEMFNVLSTAANIDVDEFI